MTRYGAIAVAQSVLSPTGRISSQALIVVRTLGIILVGLFAWGITIGNDLLLAEEKQPGMACISDMALPVYAGIFWQAQTTGTVKVKIALSSGGTPSEVQVIESPHPSFAIWLPGWFKKSSFLPQCGGKTIELTIKYRLEGLRRESPDNQVVIKFPDTFEITAHPPILHQTID
jgi:hypothetical protein